MILQMLMAIFDSFPCLVISDGLKRFLKRYFGSFNQVLFTGNLL